MKQRPADLPCQSGYRSWTVGFAVVVIVVVFQVFADAGKSDQQCFGSKPPPVLQGGQQK